MKKIPRFLMFFIVLFILALAATMFYLMKVAGTEKTWLLYQTLVVVFRYLPVIAALSVLWALLYKSPNEIPNTNSTFLLPFIFFTIFNLSLAFLANEFFLPVLHDNIIQNRILKRQHMKVRPHLKDVNPGKLRISEFKSLKYFPYRKNIVFAMDRGFVHFERLYKADKVFYVKGFTLVAYDANHRLDFSVSAPYGKINGNKILTLGARFIQYRNGKVYKIRQYKRQHSYPLLYSADGIYSLYPDASEAEISLWKVLRYRNFLLHSKISFYNYSIAIYNKISYYSIFLILLIFASALGQSLKNQRSTTIKDFIQLAASYLVSFVIIVLVYDTLIAATNMIFILSS